MVTVVIPTFNRGQLLTELLDSLAGQDYPSERLEIIVVENGASADSDQRVDEAAAKHQLSIRHHRMPANRGPGPSREQGRKMAKGEIVAFIDDDCVATPQWVRCGVAGFHDGVALVQGRTLPNPDHPRHRFEKTIHIAHETPVYETCNIFYRRDAMEAVGGFSPEFDSSFPIENAITGEDTDLAWKVKQAGYQTAFAPDALVYHGVFKVPYMKWLKETHKVAVWPYLIQKFPALRRHLSWNYFLSKETAAFDLLLVGGLLACLHSAWWLLLTIPYFLVRCLVGKKGPPHVMVGKILVGLPRSVYLFGLLVYSSVRFRRLVL
jgi:glycosyltransferase involved in cell wall biosynthesis